VGRTILQGLEELGQVLRYDSHVGIEDHQDLAACRLEPGPHRVRLAVVRIVRDQPDARVDSHQLLDPTARFVGGAVVDDDDLAGALGAGPAVRGRRPGEGPPGGPTAGLLSPWWGRGMRTGRPGAGRGPRGRAAMYGTDDV